MKTDWAIWVAGTMLLMATFTAGATATEMTDASVWVYSKHKHLGVNCPHCHHTNPIRPWSL